VLFSRIMEKTMKWNKVKVNKVLSIIQIVSLSILPVLQYCFFPRVARSHSLGLLRCICISECIYCPCNNRNFKHIDCNFEEEKTDIVSMHVFGVASRFDLSS